SNYQTQLEYIQKEIKKDTRKAALMFLRIAKHNIHMKTEFSIYRKLDRSDSSIELRPHTIQKVLMNVLHTFFIDFTNNGILVDVDNYYGKVQMDYETIQVALYHLIENASKYTKPNSRIKVQFIELEQSVEILFTMTSLFIEEEEIDKIFTEGYSGKEARNCEVNGDGIGMWRIKQMMHLNKGDISIIRGTPKVISDGRGYAVNRVLLKFLKK
ncbi:MAG TPA: ATP-binding protein, partial [Candidatus Dojkabacteria bacterium]|nr:ATP-binding protein [Candidatus Dojkabacteria bacterium]